MDSNTDPLSDTLPPRYAIESDDEEDEVPVPASTSSQPQVDVKIQGDEAAFAGKPLIVASFDVGKYYAKGAALGEQMGAVGVNGVQIGLVFTPSWTHCTILISEALSRLPLYAMHPYAKAILEAFNPSKLALIDTYAVPTYASAAPTNMQDAPLRYLSTATSLSDLQFLESSQALPFAPPNLLLSTSASFLALSATTSHTENPTTLILLPSPTIPAPAPKSIAPANFTTLDSDSVAWPAQTMNAAQALVFAALSEKGMASPQHEWALTSSHGGIAEKMALPKRSTEIGEGGMYI